MCLCPIPFVYMYITVAPFINGYSHEHFKTISNRTVVVNESDPVVLGCTVVSSPQPVISWSKDDSLLNNQDTDIVFNILTSIKETTNGSYYVIDDSLTFNASKLEDAGIYACVASNEAGEAKHELELIVQGESILIYLLQVF